MVSRNEINQFISRHDIALSVLFFLLLLILLFATNNFDLAKTMQGIKPADIYGGLGFALATAITIVAGNFLFQAFQPTATKIVLALALFLLFVPILEFPVAAVAKHLGTVWEYSIASLQAGDFPALLGIDIVLVIVGLLICYGISAVALHLIYKTPAHLAKKGKRQ